MLGERPTVVLERAVEMVLGERVGRVLHRVGGDHQRVVAVGVGPLEVALEGDRDGQVADPVTGRVACDPHQVDRRLAVAIGSELDHGVSSVGALPSRAARSRAMSITASMARAISPRRVGVEGGLHLGQELGPRASVDEHAVAEPEPLLVRRVEPVELARRRGRGRPRRRGRPLRPRRARSPARRTTGPRRSAGGAPSRGWASISSTCSATGMAWAICLARSNSSSSEPNGRASASRPRNRGAPSNSGAIVAAKIPAEIRSRTSIGGSGGGRSAVTTRRPRGPGDGGRGRPRAAVLRGRAHVVDRLELAGQGLRRPIGGLRRRRPALEDGLGRARPDRRRGHRAERQADVRPGSRGPAIAVAEGHDDLADRLGAPRADLAKARLPAGRQREPDPQQQLVGRQRRLPVGGPEGRRRDRLARRGPSRTPASRRAPAGPAGCRRPARRSRRCRRSCRGSGSGRRRSWRPPPPGPAGARGRAPSAGSPCTWSARRGRCASPSTAIPRSSSRCHRSSIRSGGSPSSPVRATIRSVPPAIGVIGALGQQRVGVGQAGRADDGRLDRHAGQRRPNGPRRRARLRRRRLAGDQRDDRGQDAEADRQLGRA